MTKSETQDPAESGRQSYERWRNRLRENPEYQAIYEEEAAKSKLWLQLAEARHAAGLTQDSLNRR
jgi:hypothetical protein